MLFPFYCLRCNSSHLNIFNTSSLAQLSVILSLISQVLAVFIFLFVVKNQGKVVAYITGYVFGVFVISLTF